MQEAAPAMTPEFYPHKDGYKIFLAKSPKDDPHVKYRKEAEKLAKGNHGKFSIPARKLLKLLRVNFKLQPEIADAIEAEVLEPYREYQRKLTEYETTLVETIKDEPILSETTLNDLKDYQQHLGLRDEDVAPIKENILGQRENPNISANRNPLAAPSTQCRGTSEGHHFPCLKNLKNYLTNKQWEQADKETLKIILQLANQNHQTSYLTPKSIDALIQNDNSQNKKQCIKEIDKLWYDNSNCCFGFKIQKQIYEKFDKNFDIFALNVGWKKHPEDWWISVLSWRTRNEVYSQITNQSLIRGCLPFLIYTDVNTNSGVKMRVGIVDQKLISDYICSIDFD
ncbi:MAG: GUN4 domain-containing protein [Gloeotrichia echinulata GP01]